MRVKFYKKKDFPELYSAQKEHVIELFFEYDQECIKKFQFNIRMVGNFNEWPSPKTLVVFAIK